VIKRIRFATLSRTDGDGQAWRSAMGEGLQAPADTRPSRVVVCTARTDLTPAPRHDGVGLEWFDDDAHLARFQQWLASPAGAVVGESLAAAVGWDASSVIVADEHVMRGADWLEQRWREGGQKLKHMAIALRADGLTSSQFSELWRTRAGKVGAVPIPDVAKGQAYVQNHPVARAGEDWAYDAFNEVYFDSVDHLRARIDWFAATMVDGGEDDLVSESWFVAADEDGL
jgi:hypothetical protein